LIETENRRIHNRPLIEVTSEAKQAAGGSCVSNSQPIYRGGSPAAFSYSASSRPIYSPDFVLGNVDKIGRVHMHCLLDIRFGPRAHICYNSSECTPAGLLRGFWIGKDDVTQPKSAIEISSSAVNRRESRVK
jgi:hypothetical protein